MDKLSSLANKLQSKYAGLGDISRVERGSNAKRHLRDAYLAVQELDETLSESFMAEKSIKDEVSKTKDILRALYNRLDSIFTVDI